VEFSSYTVAKFDGIGTDSILFGGGTQGSECFEAVGFVRTVGDTSVLKSAASVLEDISTFVTAQRRFQIAESAQVLIVDDFSDGRTSGGFSSLYRNWR
jgi:hypothetical protein